MNSVVEDAVKILNNGGIIVFPTDTAFGMGCRIDNEDAVRRLFKLRNRPITLPTPVLVSSIDMAKNYWLKLPIRVKKILLDTYWPGALTVVLPAKKGVISELIKGGGLNVGLRMPDNEIVLKIIEKLGVPLIGTSANFHGKKTPYKYEDLDKNLINKVDMVIKGNCTVNNHSTVIDCTSVKWKILRQGAITIHDE